jgi:hypothetical protein
MASRSPPVETAASLAVSSWNFAAAAAKPSASVQISGLAAVGSPVSGPLPLGNQVGRSAARAFSFAALATIAALSGASFRISSLIVLKVAP